MFWVKWPNPTVLHLQTTRYQPSEFQLLLQVSQPVECVQILKTVSVQWEGSLYKVYKTSSFGCIQGLGCPCVHH